MFHENEPGLVAGIEPLYVLSWAVCLLVYRNHLLPLLLLYPCVIKVQSVSLFFLLLLLEHTYLRFFLFFLPLHCPIGIFLLWEIWVASPGKASCNRVALLNPRCMLGVSVFPYFTEL